MMGTPSWPSPESVGLNPWLTLAVAGFAAWALLRRLTTLDLLKIPSPWGIPVLGQLLQMARDPAKGHLQFLRWHEAYGSIVRIRLFHRDVVLVADPQVASEVLAKGTNECARRTPEYATFNVAHGQAGFSAILTELDEGRWKAIRRGIAPAYALSTVRDHFPTIVQCYGRICERIASGAALHHPPAAAAAANATTSPEPAQSAAAAAPAPEVWIDEEIMAATVAVLLEAFLKVDRATAGIDVFKTAAAGGQLVAITNTFISQPWKQWLYLAIPGLCKESRAFHTCRQHMASVTHQLAKHIEAQRPAAAVDLSLAACLARLAEPGSGKPFSTAALQAELFLELVGQESVPWTVAWTLYCLSQHPEAEAAVLQELRVAGLPCNGDLAAAQASLSMDLLKQLPVCTAVLHEAMRLYPAGVAAAPRMTDKVTRVGPYRVPPGVIVFPCLYSILNYSQNWDRPQQFDPSRWLEDPNYATHPATGSARFVPFGIGPKACVAQHLAMVQCKVLLALLLSCYSWRLASRMGGPAGVESNCVAALELRVAGGMWLNPTARTAASK